ncbi:MAG: copper chaperone PCu(A)C [Rhizobiales bacterium]|nr:copper chaperone PCu(A)C [Hyphomicrobiales bacterium]MBO6700409.1 copper chaperone PCu(A)C [Hyphomicrobiales bacterium]MBO6737945.1 copper chaperone PCu(A)C [Hyphomicrobiales bacterium]MBO6913748.1 copper chaperone PCu(A)C [Hyphomicrobiales bacterium]MBO6954357.1 copper chaperone PCu(A)C [Hyphomicrobiales bacterium]
MTKFAFLTAGALALALSSSIALAHDGGHGHDHGDDMTMVGDLELSNLRVIETPPNARNAGGFLTIMNMGDSDDRLVAAFSPAAERVELHTMTMDGDVMRMRELEDGIALPAGEMVELAPGGLHVMFIGLTGPFVAGETVAVTLTFESGASQDLTLPVIERAMEMNHGGHGTHGSTN